MGGGEGVVRTDCLVESRKGVVVHGVVACAEERAEATLAEGGPEILDVVWPGWRFCVSYDSYLTAS